jgi:peptidoglycan/LPS O-acetylase OafA/YrhL
VADGVSRAGTIHPTASSRKRVIGCFKPRLSIVNLSSAGSTRLVHRRALTWTLLNVHGAGQYNTMANERAASATPYGHTQFRATTYFATLDVLRAIAVIAVIWHHTAATSFAETFANKGNYGVTLFFAISGFLIVTQLLRERSLLGDISVRTFMIKRALRILPLYYATLLIYVIVVALLEKDVTARSQFFANLPAFATFTSNWCVASDAPRVIFLFAWSLAAEEQFYLVWPWIERAKFGKHTGLFVATAAVALSPDFAGAFWQPGEVQPWPLVALSRLPAAIGLGVTLAHLLHNPRVFQLIAPVIGRRGSALGSLVLLAVALYSGDLFGRSEPSIVSLLCMLLVGAVVIRPDNDLAVLQRIPGVMHIGVVSYGLYLLHMLSANAVKVALAPLGSASGTLLFAATLIVALMVATLSHVTLERFMLALRGRFLRGTSGGLSGPPIHKVQPQQAFAR